MGCTSFFLLFLPFDFTFFFLYLNNVFFFCLSDGLFQAPLNHLIFNINNKIQHKNPHKNPTKSAGEQEGPTAMQQITASQRRSSQLNDTVQRISVGPKPFAQGN